MSQPVALGEPYMRASSVQRMLEFPAETLRSLRPRCTASRRQWERFVAVRLTAAEVFGMEPILLPGAIVVLDRHYNSLAPYRGATATQPHLYGVRNHHRLSVRYVDFLAGRLVLRTHRPEIPVDVVEPLGEESPNDLLIGRVALIVNEP